MIQVIVLAGGDSDEREISLQSGAAVTRALKKAGYAVSTLDPVIGLDNLLAKLQKADMVFPALHGRGGEDGILQKFLEEHSSRYVGPDSRASALCFNKALYTKMLHRNKIHVPDTELVKYDEYHRSDLIRKPYVLKPNDGGSSIDTFIVRDPENADVAAIKKAFKRHKKLLLQELIEGVEITVAMLGDQPLPVIEIIPPADGEFDYENKYNGRTQELCPPKHVSPEIQIEAQALAKQVHQLAGCRDMSRTDFIVNPVGKIYTLETNTIPGLTGESLLPKAARETGSDMPTLCSKLVQSALQRNT
jgi:D-alanine-D-alanine ligase